MLNIFQRILQHIRIWKRHPKQNVLQCILEIIPLEILEICFTQSLFFKQNYVYAFKLLLLCNIIFHFNVLFYHFIFFQRGSWFMGLSYSSTTASIPIYLALTIPILYVCIVLLKNVWSWYEFSNKNRLNSKTNKSYLRTNTFWN